ncbi:MAG TPA: hypothetical protein VFA85_11080 [Terriglobales bacterium]|nr:hypothetical protein [Terriglobales bacterium]
MSSLIARVRTKEIALRWPGRSKKCASPECARSHTPWRPVADEMDYVRFRGAEFCFPKCFSRELLRLLEQPSSRVPAACVKPRRMPLGLLMLSRGDLTEQQLLQALSAQKNAGSGKIGEWLRRLQLAGEYEIAAALAQQWSCPLMRTLPTRLADCLVPATLFRALRMAPVHFSTRERVLHLAFAGSIAYKALVAIEQMLELKTKACLTTEQELADALNRIGYRQRDGEKLFQNCRDMTEVVGIICNYARALAAREIRCLSCGQFLWARILAGAQCVDLLFPQQNIHREGISAL